MMRNVYRYRYAVIIDFDEVIIPRFHDDYAEMVTHIDRQFRIKDRPYTYTFSNTYFFLSFKQDTEQPAYLRTLRFRQRVPPTGVRLFDSRCCRVGCTLSDLMSRPHPPMQG